MSKILNSIVLGSLISTSLISGKGNVAINNNSCQNLSRLETTNTEILEIRDNYKNIVKNISICEEKDNFNQNEDFRKNIIDKNDLLTITTSEKTKKKINRLKGEKQDIVIDIFSKLSNNYNINSSNIDKLYREVYRLSIYKLKNNIKASTSAIQEIIKILSINNVVVYNSIKTEIVNKQLLLELSKILNIEIDLDIINYDLKLSLDIGNIESITQDINKDNIKGINNIKENISIMIDSIEKDLELLDKGIGKISLIENKIKVFIDYNKGKKTFINGFVDNYNENRIIKIINEYNKAKRTN